MTDEELAQRRTRKALKALRKQYQDYPASLIEKQIANALLIPAERQVFISLLAKRRRKVTRLARHFRHRRVCVVGGVWIQSHHSPSVREAAPAPAPTQQQMIVTSPTPTESSDQQ